MSSSESRWREVTEPDVICCGRLFQLNSTQSLFANSRKYTHNSGDWKSLVAVVESRVRGTNSSWDEVERRRLRNSDSAGWWSLSARYDRYSTQALELEQSAAASLYRQLARRWLLNPVIGCYHVPPGPRLPSYPQSVTAIWPVTNYTAWWQRRTCVKLWTTCTEFCYMMMQRPGVEPRPLGR